MRRDSRGRFAPAARSEGTDADTEFTSAGSKRLEDVGEKFEEFVTSMAAVNARRRGADSADNSDVDEAFRRLLSTRTRPRVVDIGSEIGLVAAGALLGYGVTLLTASPPTTGPGWAILSAGAFVGVFSATLKHTDMS